METKIKLLKPLYIDGAIFQSGQLKLVNELHARELVKKGYAVLALDPPKLAEAEMINDEVKSDGETENGNEKAETTEPVAPKKESSPKKQK